MGGGGPEACLGLTPLAGMLGAAPSKRAVSSAGPKPGEVPFSPFPHEHSARYALGPEGIAPICCMIDIMSITPQCS